MSKPNWLTFANNILLECDLNHMWLYQSTFVKFPANILKPILQSNFMKQWKCTVYNSRKCDLYRIYKEDFAFENYLYSTSRKVRRTLCKFRTCNHKLPIERQRYTNIPRDMRRCDQCDSQSIGDEYHFLLECPKYNTIRQSLLPTFCHHIVNTYIFKNVMSPISNHGINNLSCYISLAFQEIDLHI